MLVLQIIQYILLVQYIWPYINSIEGVTHLATSSFAKSNNHCSRHRGPDKTFRSRRHLQDRTHIFATLMEQLTQPVPRPAAFIVYKSAWPKLAPSSSLISETANCCPRIKLGPAKPSERDNRSSVVAEGPSINDSCKILRFSDTSLSAFVAD